MATKIVPFGLTSEVDQEKYSIELNNNEFVNEKGKA